MPCGLFTTAIPWLLSITPPTLPDPVIIISIIFLWDITLNYTNFHKKLTLFSYLTQSPSWITLMSSAILAKYPIQLLKMEKGNIRHIKLISTCTKKSIRLLMWKYRGICRGITKNNFHETVSSYSWVREWYCLSLIFILEFDSVFNIFLNSFSKWLHHSFYLLNSQPAVSWLFISV